MTGSRAARTDLLPLRADGVCVSGADMLADASDLFGLWAAEAGGV